MWVAIVYIKMVNDLSNRSNSAVNAAETFGTLLFRGLVLRINILLAMTLVSMMIEKCSRTVIAETG